MVSNDENSERWCRYDRPFRVFGPLLRISDVLACSEAAGFGRYMKPKQQALARMANYARDFLAQPHPQLGRDGNVCPFVPTALQRGLLRATVTDASDVLSVEFAMEEILTVFRDLDPKSPPPYQTAEGDQIFKAILIGFPDVADDQAPAVIDELQRRLKSIYIKAGMMIGQFHPTCPNPGLHNSEFRPLQAPLPCLAIRHITKFDAPFMDRDEYADGYLRLFGLEGLRRLQAWERKHGSNGCPAHPLDNAA